MLPWTPGAEQFEKEPREMEAVTLQDHLGARPVVPLALPLEEEALGAVVVAAVVAVDVAEVAATPMTLSVRLKLTLRLLDDDVELPVESVDCNGRLYRPPIHQRPERGLLSASNCNFIIHYSFILIGVQSIATNWNNNNRSDASQINVDVVIE